MYVYDRACARACTCTCICMRVRMHLDPREFACVHTHKCILRAFACMHLRACSRAGLIKTQNAFVRKNHKTQTHFGFRNFQDVLYIVTSLILPPLYPPTLTPSLPHTLPPSHPPSLTPSLPHTLPPSHPPSLTPSYPLSLLHILPLSHPSLHHTHSSSFPNIHPPSLPPSLPPSHSLPDCTADCKMNIHRYYCVSQLEQPCVGRISGGMSSKRRRASQPNRKISCETWDYYSELRPLFTYVFSEIQVAPALCKICILGGGWMEFQPP